MNAPQRIDTTPDDAPPYRPPPFTERPSLTRDLRRVLHDLRNALSAVCVDAECAVLRNAEGDDPTAILESVLDTAEHGNALLRQLLRGFGGEAPGHGPMELVAVIRGSVDLARSMLRPHHELIVDLPESIELWTTGNPKHIRRIVANLAANARDAMPDGGTLEIALCSAHDGTPTPTESIAAPAAAILKVEDTGVGMAPETLRNAFKPNFTTKAPGEGTGLGLSVVRDLVFEHGGEIALTSRRWLGTRITIALPARARRPRRPD